MKIRTSAEIKSMDQELNLFDEEAWKFMSVVDNFDVNYEYFSDIRDTQFAKKSKWEELKLNIPAISLVVIISCVITYGLSASGLFIRNGVVDYLNTMQTSVDEGTKVEYADGVEASSEELIEISQVLQRYFSCLRSEYDYSRLYDCCLVTSSFADTYEKFTSQVVNLYDTNDCYARALREFGGFYSISEIDKVIVNGSTYYCYVDINLPSVADINEYVYMYAHNMTKHFQVVSVNEANIVSYLLSITKDNPIPCTKSRICIKFKRNLSGDLLMVDDTYFASQCLDLYTEVVTHITNILGGTLTTD